MSGPQSAGNAINDNRTSDSSSPEDADFDTPGTRSSERRSSDWLQETTSQTEDPPYFEEARKREEQFRLLEEEATEYAIMLLGPNGNIVTWNRGVEQLTGYAEEEILGRHVSVFYQPDDRDAGVPETALQTAMHEGSWTGKGWRVRKDGSRFWARERIRPIAREEGTPQGYASVLRDLTRRRQLQRETLEVQEEEWRRIKEDLHQVSGSQLTGANLLMERTCREVQDEDLASRFQRIRSLISESSESLQKISRKLTPNGLSRGGLPEALARLAEDTEGGHFEAGSVDRSSSEDASPESEETLPELREDIASQLYWIAREATTSARRHEKTDEIVLRLTKEDGTLVLLVKDDSEGDGDASGEDRSIATRIMRRRANLIGASLTVETFPGDGTRVQCRLPV